MKIPPGVLGIFRALAVMVGWTLITTVLAFFMNPANLPGLDPTVAGLIVLFATSVEHIIEARTGKALFGTVRQA